MLLKNLGRRQEVVFTAQAFCILFLYLVSFFSGREGNDFVAPQYLILAIATGQRLRGADQFGYETFHLLFADPLAASLQYLSIRMHLRAFGSL